MSDFKLRFHVPNPTLQPLISSYYLLDFPPDMPIRDQMLPEWGNIRLILSGKWIAELSPSQVEEVPPAVLVGFTSRSFTISSAGNSRIVGIGLLPKGWARLIGQDADMHADRMSDLSSAFGAGSMDLWNRVNACTNDAETAAVLDAFFLNIISVRPEAPKIMDAVLALLEDDTVTTVDAFANGLGLSPRQAARVSLKYFGFSPKLLLRRQRFLRAFSKLRHIKMGSWIDHLDVSYTDQSHFIREFRYFMRTSPGVYFASQHAILSKTTDLRQKALGAAVQGLHVTRSLS
jgi:AraC-like DNA-binding protein